MRLGSIVLGSTLVLTWCVPAVAARTLDSSPFVHTGTRAVSQRSSLAHLSAKVVGKSETLGALQNAPASNAAGTKAFQQGSALLHARQYKAAEAQFRRAIALHTDVAQSYDGLGTSAVGLGDYTTAFQAYVHAVALQPQNPAYLYRAAYTGLYAQSFKHAASYATQYIKFRPKDVNGYRLRMLAYERIPKIKQAIQDAHIIVTLRPKDPASYNDLAIALGQGRQYKASIATFTQAIHMQPGNGSLYTNRALVENLNHQPKLALQDLQKALQLATDPATKRQLEQAISNLKKAMHKGKHH